MGATGGSWPAAVAPSPARLVADMLFAACRPLPARRPVGGAQLESSCKSGLVNAGVGKSRCGPI